MKTMEDHIREGNKWYTGDQHLSLENRSFSGAVENRWRFFRRVLTQLEEKHVGKLRILDAGCGDGINLGLLVQEFGERHLVEACDYNPLRVEKSHAKYDVPVFQQDLTRSLPQPGYDFILLSQVIEHIPQDRLVLEALRSALNPDGILLLGTPNEGCFLAKVRNHVWEKRAFKKSDHVHFYTLASLMELADRAGFVTEAIYRERFFFPSSRLFQRMYSSAKNEAIANRLMAWFPSQVAGHYLILREKQA